MSNHTNKKTPLAVHAMQQTARIIATHSADTFGVCSALFELGGMVVIHDPSGCNSTYTTHDEPRWYDRDSLIYVTAMTERDAVLGDDNRTIRDIVTAAKQQEPRFICLIPSQIAHLIGTDCRALARIIEKKTGILTFTLPTNSMYDYERGIFFAMEKLAKLVCKKAERHPSATEKEAKDAEPEEKSKVNILGATPLDFAINGSIASIEDWLTVHGFTVQSTWTMGNNLDRILSAYKADCNLVISCGGLGVAKVFEERYHIPYVVGLPIASERKSLLSALQGRSQENLPNQPTETSRHTASKDRGGRYIIGETVQAQVLARALTAATGKLFTAIVPVSTASELLDRDTLLLTDECDLIPIFEKASLILADPMYRPIIPTAVSFLPLPLVGFSGRTYLKQIPNLINKTAFNHLLAKVKEILCS